MVLPRYLRRVSPIPEPTFGDGKDALHRVPDLTRNEWAAVERVLATFLGQKCSGGRSTCGLP